MCDPVAAAGRPTKGDQRESALIDAHQDPVRGDAPTTVAVVARWPASGSGKRRLAAGVGDDEAARIYGALLDRYPPAHRWHRRHPAGRSLERRALGPAPRPPARPVHLPLPAGRRAGRAPRRPLHRPLCRRSPGRHPGRCRQPGPAPALRDRRRRPAADRRRRHHPRTGGRRRLLPARIDVRSVADRRAGAHRGVVRHAHGHSSRRRTRALWRIGRRPASRIAPTLGRRGRQRRRAGRYASDA